MELLSLKLFVTAVNGKIEALEADRNHAASNEYFDKAAKINSVIEGVRKSILIAQSGDCHANNEPNI